jgi:hypothetical protein
VCRLLWLQGYAPHCEVPLADGRRADVVAVDAAGAILIVEVKVSVADLKGDRKWQAYRDWCDSFAWAVPETLAPLLDDARFAPGTAGLIVSDGFDAAEIRPPASSPLAPARRKALLLRLARLGAARALRAADPAFDAQIPWT